MRGRLLALLPVSSAVSCSCLSYQEGQDDIFNLDVDGLADDRRQANLSYGIGCGKHDVNGPFSACSLNPPEDWCGDAWCYVSSDCTLAKKLSRSRLGRHYSYAQCGYLDRFTSVYVESRNFDRQVINVVLMTNSGGWKGSYCERDGRCSGPTHRLLEDLVQRTGAIANVTATFYGGPLADYPGAYAEQVMEPVRRDQQTSAFTACLYATGMGYVDICIGAFTATPARDLLSLNVHLWAEPVYLISPKEEVREDFFDNLARAFSPFTGLSWLCILGFLLAASILVMLQERSGHFRDHGLAYGAVEATYIGLNSFFSASQCFDAQSLGGRMTTLAMGFIILLTISAYTANLASDLIARDEPTATITSLDVVIASPSYRICTQDSSYLVSNLNFPESKIVLVDGRREVLDAIGSSCEAAVMALEDFEAGQTDSSLCHLMRVGDPLFYEQQMSPVSERFKRSATFHLRAARVEGTWARTLREHKPTNACTIQSEATQSVGMEPKDMAGPLIIAGTICILGIVADFVKAMLNRRRAVEPKRQTAAAAEEAIEEIQEILSRLHARSL